VIPTARQYVPRAEFKDNLVRIVALVREAWPDVVVVLITPPPVDVDKWDGTKGHLTKGQRSLKNAEDYAVATREAAAAAGCSCLDLFARIKAYEGGDSAGAVAVARGCKVAHEDARLVRHVPEAVPERGEVKKVAPTSGFRVPGAVPQWP